MMPRFEVYTYFGRVVSRHHWNPDKELHHRASEDARIACAKYPGTAWVRYIR
jgi:hypothetical protein